MKIAFVIHKLAGRSGGAERILVETANEMARRGHRVWILHHENRGIGPFYETDKQVTVRNLFKRPIEKAAKERWEKRERLRDRLPHFFPFARIKWEMSHGGFVNKLREFIESEAPDALIPFLPSAITPCAIAARGQNVKVIASTHNEPSQDYDNRKRWDKNPIDVKLRMQVLSDIDQILVLLPEYRDWYPVPLQSKIGVMANPIRPAAKDALATSAREKIVIAVGRLSEVKRFNLLVDAWLDLHSRYPDWKVEIYGDGPDRESLESMIRTYGLSDCVFLKGVTKEIDAQYLRASLMCHPSQYEGFPLAVCEALAHGVPVVGFDDCSGLNALVKHEKNGILADGSKPKSIALLESLDSLLSNEAMRNSLSREAPRTVSQYAPEIIYDRWEELIEDVVACGEDDY